MPFLLQSNANVKTMDHEGRTCVSYARSSSASGGSGANSDLIDLLLNNGCPDVPHTGGTLPRRKNSLIGPGRAEGVMEKVTSSVLWFIYLVPHIKHYLFLGVLYFQTFVIVPPPPFSLCPEIFFYIYMSFAVITFEDLIARKFCWGVSVKVGCMCFSQKTKDGNTFSPSGLHLNENLYAFKTPLNSFFCQRKNKFEFVQWHTPSQKFYVKIVKQDTSA